MKIKLKRTDEPLPQIDIINDTTVLGRGKLLQCMDKRVSRNHAELSFTKSMEIFLTPKHINPCFIHENGECRPMKQNVPVALKTGDIFSLLPYKYSFRISFDNQCKSDDKDVSPEGQSKKRLLPDWFNKDDSVPVNKKRTETKSQKKDDSLPVNKKRTETKSQKKDDSLPVNKKRTETKSQKKDFGKKIKQLDKDNEQSSKKMLNSESASDDEQNDVLQDSSPSGTNDIKNSNTDDNSDSDMERRDVCLYGSDCFRKNISHLKKYSHPGDDDYIDVNSNDNEKPECRYGINCYRTNSHHQKMYKHTKRVQPRRATAKKKTRKTDHNSDSEFSDIESDLTDSDDLTDESDVYEPESDED